MKTGPGLYMPPAEHGSQSWAEEPPSGGLRPQHRGAVTPLVKTSDETRRYLWAHGGTSTWGGVRQVDVIHRVFHQWPFEHVHVGDGEDALPGRPRDPPFVPVLVHLSEQRDPLTLEDTARHGPCPSLPQHPEALPAPLAVLLI